MVLTRLRQSLVALLCIAILGVYWMLPISGQVVVLPEEASPAMAWPRIQVDPVSLGSNQKITVQVTDIVPWANVLVTIDGESAELEGWSSDLGGTWTWRWTFTPTGSNAWPEERDGIIAFYHDCDGGCKERALLALGAPSGSTSLGARVPTTAPTKMGVVFANPNRDWHGRSGWVVDLTYARLPQEPYWGMDDLAARVVQSTAKGMKVLVRVDYDRGQSLPPSGDQLALTEYLQYVRRLARDDRLRGVYGYIIGSGFNALDSNAQASDHPVSPAWYARVFNGYGQPISHSDNVAQVVRRENALARVIVGPVRPWVWDQDGDREYAVNVPWLGYMNSLVANLDESARLKSAAGVSLVAPDGFALQAPGRVNAAELNGRNGSEEPRIDLRRAEWGGAQAGFRVYRDWLEIINGYDTTRWLPVYITSVNTFAPDDGIPPAQNYPPGWLTSALETVNNEPQILALAWFMDGPLGDAQWDWFSLSRPSGKMIDAATEFDILLQR